MCAFIERKALSITIVFLSILSFTSSVVASEKYVIKLGTIAAPSHVGSYPQNEKFGELVKKITNGQVEVQVIGSSQLGDERKLAESLQMGTLEMAGITPIVLANFEKKLDIFALPYVFNSFKAQYYVQYGPIGKEAAEALTQGAGIRILAYITGTYRQFFTKIPINKMEDMKGLKLRSMENPVYIRLFKGFGANPVPMGFGEMITGLKAGIVDGFDLPAWVVPLSKLYENVRYCAVTNHVITPFTLSISEKVFQKYPRDIQAALIEAAKETTKWHDPRIEKLESDTLAGLPTVGVTVTRPDLRPFKEVGKKLAIEWAEKNNMVDEITKIINIE
jgi:tripartite ATP-independent transporter DctP family solute receptor